MHLKFHEHSGSAAGSHGGDSSAGYTEDEKLNIAQRYLVPKQIKNNGLKADELEITDLALVDLIRYYTKEAGVRGLEREIAKVARKVVKEQSLKADLQAKGQGKEVGKEICENGRRMDQLDHYSGVRKFSYGRAEEKDQIGIVTGLAWTQVGGELLNIEAVSMPGKVVRRRPAHWATLCKNPYKRR